MSGSKNTSLPNTKIDESSQHILDVFSNTYRAWLFGYPATIAQETLRFAAHRLGEQAKLISTLSNCTNLSEVADAQTAFFNVAVKEYREEAEIVAHRTQETISSTHELKAAA